MITTDEVDKTKGAFSLRVTLVDNLNWLFNQALIQALYLTLSARYQVLTTWMSDCLWLGKPFGI